MKPDSKTPSMRLGASAVALALAALLAACGALPDKPARSTLYDFGPGPMNAAAPATSTSLPPLALAEIESNARLDGNQILYRFAYADGNELRPYGQSRWSLAPAQLLRQRLRDALAVDHTVMAPSDLSSAARTDGRRPPILRVTLEEFSQVFDTPTHSVGLVRVSATLIGSDAAGKRTMTQRTFTAQRPAPSSDAAGGVQALAAASDAVVGELVAWVAAADPAR